MIGEKLTYLREEACLTQQEVAEELNISPQSISKWERNEAYPSTEHWPKLAELYDCSIDYFFTKVDNPTPRKELKNFNEKTALEVFSLLKSVYVDGDSDILLKSYALINRKSLDNVLSILLYVQESKSLTFLGLQRTFRIGFSKAGEIIDGIELLNLAHQEKRGTLTQRVVDEDKLNEFISFLKTYIEG